VQLTVPLGRAADRPDLLLQPCDLLELVPRLAALKARAFGDGILIMPGNNLGYFGPEEGRLRAPEAGGEEHWQGCQAGRYVMGIESNGAVKGCPSLQTQHYVDCARARAAAGDARPAAQGHSLKRRCAAAGAAGGPAQPSRATAAREGRRSVVKRRCDWRYTGAMVLSYAQGPSDVPLLGETIGQALRRTVERFGDREALVVRSQGYRASWRALDDASALVGRGLIAHGVVAGDRVGIWSPNRYEWVVTQLACARIGAILVNLNPAYKTAELEYALRQSSTSVLIHARAFRSSDYAAMVGEVRPQLPALRLTLCIDDDWAALQVHAARCPVAELAAREARLQFDDAINIQYTSGTTGFPKGATLTHHNIVNNGYFVGRGCGYTADDRVCIPVPFYHCFGMVMGVLACVTSGAAMIIAGEAFDAAGVLETVAAERCTSLYGVPTMFIAELDHPHLGELDLTSLRTGIMAGSPCPIEVMKAVRTRLGMRDVTICYGMTETSPVSTQTALDDPLELRVGSVGRVHPHLELKIVDEAGRIVARGERGELCTRGYSVMLGYWADEEATRGAIDGARWMHSGDLATMNDAGYVNIVGRIKDMIIRGGENIYPREVEEFLHTHPAISEAQVIGVPSAKYGEEVMAWVRLKPGLEVDGDTLSDFCRGRIATYKIPRWWKLVDSFPLTVTGKVQKFRMREVALVELELLREDDDESA
jgi:fatty-acyl-CoA synthase